MNQNEIVQALKKEATENKAAGAFFKVCAERERARSQVTLTGMMQRMKKSGFDFPVEEYSRILKLLADLGLGKAVIGTDGKPNALKDIRIALQSIGKAAIGTGKLEGWKPRNKFSTLTAPMEVVKPQQPASGATARDSGYPVSITVVINGKPVNFRVPKELNETEIADLVVRFRDKGVGSERSQ